MATYQKLFLEDGIDIKGDAEITKGVKAGKLSTVDPYITTSSNYVATSGRPAGLVTTYKATAVSSGLDEFLSTDTVVGLDSGAGFLPGDIVQITGAHRSTNNSLYQVATYSGDTLTIATAPSSPEFNFFKFEFDVDGGNNSSAQIVKVCVGVMQINAAGQFRAGRGDNVFTNFVFEGLDPNVGGDYLNFTSTMVDFTTTPLARFNTFSNNGPVFVSLPEISVVGNGVQALFIFTGSAGTHMEMTIETSGPDTLDNGEDTQIVLDNQYQRVNMVGIEGIWYIS